MPRSCPVAAGAAQPAAGGGLLLACMASCWRRLSLQAHAPLARRRAALFLVVIFALYALELIRAACGQAADCSVRRASFGLVIASISLPWYNITETTDACTVTESFHWYIRTTTCTFTSSSGCMICPPGMEGTHDWSAA